MGIVQVFLIVIAVFIVSGCSNASSKDDTSIDTTNVRVSCVGDSITEGTGLSNPSKDSYPAQLSSMLGTGWEVGNFGKKSATVLKSGTTPYWNTSTFIPSHDFHPDIVIIMLGTNDAKPINWVHKTHFVENYSELIQSYKNLSSHPKVYICYPPPVYGEVAGITDARIKNEIIPKIRQIASRNDVEVIDIYTSLRNKRTLFPDKVHPNKEGARLLAQKVYQTIY